MMLCYAAPRQRLCMQILGNAAAASQLVQWLTDWKRRPQEAQPAAGPAKRKRRPDSDYDSRGAFMVRVCL